MKWYKVGLLVFIVLLIDQVSKIWVKLNMMLNQQYVITDWFRIYFTENPGMAFGMELPGIYGKLLLSGFRLIAIAAIIYYIRILIIEKAHPGFIYCVGLILAGAAGNVIDSAVYGLVFSGSYGQVATLFPAGGGYAGFLSGHVVDMLWFPLWEGFLPEWLPFWGGKFFIFFEPVFNIADAAISIGVALIVIFQKKFFPDQKEVVADTSATASDAAANEETTTT